MVIGNPYINPEPPNKRFVPRDTSDWPEELWKLPNDPILREPAAHETSGVLRLHRSGLTGTRLAGMLKIAGTKLMEALQRALDQEGEATRADRVIHDAPITKQDAADYLKEAEAP